MINAIIIDDEEIAVSQLDYLLQQYPEISVMAKFTDPLTALEKINLYQPDLIFLDIKMPEINGLVVAEEIMKILQETYIVFVTAHDEYALDAFDYNAIDYIIKPVTAKRMDKTIQKVLTSLKKGQTNSSFVSNISNVTKLYCKFSKIIAAEEAGRIIILNPSEVIMFTPRGHSTSVHTSEKTYNTKQSMNYWEDRLAEFNFFRCHKSFLVNFDKVEKILPMFNNTYLLKLSDYQEEIPVSRNKAKELSKMLGL